MREEGVWIKLNLKRKTKNISEENLPENHEELINEIKNDVNNEDSSESTNDDDNQDNSELTDDDENINNKIKELQTVIKVNDKGNSEKNQVPTEKKEEDLDKLNNNTQMDKNVLQNIKNFEFQISENQDNINKLNEKVDDISKNLDDLVSLYEIVSEQMNPFVGLSKATKMRIEALENFTKELDFVKNRIENIESEMSQGQIFEIEKYKSDNTEMNKKTNLSTDENKINNNQKFEDTTKKSQDSVDNLFDEDFIDLIIDNFIKNNLNI